MSFVLIGSGQHTGCMTSTHTVQNTPTIAIRTATPDDRAALRRLATLDSAPMPTGEVLLGVVDGELRAAVPVAGGRTIADPFRATAEVVALLQVRAERLRGEHAPGVADAVLVSAARRMWRATALRT